MLPFKTFFIGGYECADMINNTGNRVNLLRATFHDTHIDEDYQLLTEAGIRTVREGIVWSAVEKQPYEYDFSEVTARIRAAQKWGVQQLWDICHFGYATDLVPAHPQFVHRFAALCTAFLKHFRSLSNEAFFFCPINEMSFISWLGGDMRGTVPFAVNSGWDVKYHLAKAAIAGIQAVREIEPAAQVMLVEPMIKIHPRSEEPDVDGIRGHNESQFEAMDLVTGRKCPELGGKPEYMNYAGFNYYYNNQWVHCSHTLDWRDQPYLGTPFSQLLALAYERFGVPVILSETGHFDEDRSLWMEMITTECIKAMEQGVDLRGICIYPVLDRPDWDYLDKYIACGIWGYRPDGTRTVEQSYLNTVKACIARTDAFLNKGTGDAATVTFTQKVSV